jgi:hypothetical protein
MVLKISKTTLHTYVRNSKDRLKIDKYTNKYLHKYTDSISLKLIDVEIQINTDFQYLFLNLFISIYTPVIPL